MKIGERHAARDVRVVIIGRGKSIEFDEQDEIDWIWGEEGKVHGNTHLTSAGSV